MASGWFLRPLGGDGKRTELTYVVHSAAGGACLSTCWTCRGAQERAKKGGGMERESEREIERRDEGVPKRRFVAPRSCIFFAEFHDWPTALTPFSGISLAATSNHVPISGWIPAWVVNVSLLWMFFASPQLRWASCSGHVSSRSHCSFLQRVCAGQPRRPGCQRGAGSGSLCSIKKLNSVVLFRTSMCARACFRNKEYATTSQLLW